MNIHSGSSRVALALAFATGIRCGAPNHDSVRPPPAKPATPAASAALVVPSGRATPAPNTDDPTRHRGELVARAERALRRRWPLDYRLPFSRTPYDEIELASLYLEACRAGDKPSCWNGAQIQGWGGLDEGRPATMQVIENCRSGDLLSCRAMSYLPEVRDGMGAVGRSRTCILHPDDPCDLDALRRECDAGFPQSCSQLADRSGPGTADREAAMARFASLVMEGCRVRIIYDCLSLADIEIGSFGLEQICPLDAFACRSLGEVFKKRGDLIRARDLLERDCQYNGGAHACIDLGQDYVSGTLPEPFPGRGEALIRWGCPLTLEGTVPVCKAHEAARAKPP
jgi:hypothetical protein